MVNKNPVELLKYFSFHTSTNNHKDRKVVPFNKARKIIRELSKEIIYLNKRNEVLEAKRSYWELKFKKLEEEN